MGVVLALLAIVLFLVSRSGGADPENVTANDEGPIPEAAIAAAQAAAYAEQAANTASVFFLLTDGPSSSGWERVSQAWEEVIQAWEQADSIVAYYRAEAAAGRALELTRSAFDRESDNAEFLYDKARFDEEYRAAGESLAVGTATRAVVAAAQAAFRASNSAIEAAQHVEDERPADAFGSVREAGEWVIQAATAADEVVWQSSDKGIYAAVAEEEAAARAAAEAVAAEEYAIASQAVFQAPQRLDDAIYEVDRYGQNDRDARSHVSQLGAISPVVAGAAVRADTYAPDYAAALAAQWASDLVAQHYARGRAITGQ